MKAQIHLNPNFALPIEAHTNTFGVLAVRGAGKSNTGAVMAEEFFAAGLPFVVIDPVGSWWGLRSSADGTGPGLAIAIFGGRHGDVPLERGAGELLADLVVEKRLSCVLDLSEFESERAKKQFLLEFATRLYRKNTEPLHLFLEEADDYMPQKPMKDELHLMRAWENIVRRGRARGLGLTLITQRSASLNKSVLTQIETLIAMRTTSPQDRAAIEAWVSYQGEKRDILASLPLLAAGEAWFWSPHFAKVCERVQIRRRRTFDSGATPKHSTKSRPAAKMADVDLAAIRAQMKEAIERAEANDPDLMRGRIWELEDEIERLKKEKQVDPEALESAIRQAVAADRESLRRKLNGLVDRVTEIEVATDILLDDIHAIEKDMTPTPAASRPAGTVKATETRRVVQCPPSAKPSAGEDMPRMHRAMLTALAQHMEGLTKSQILLHADYRSSGPVSKAFADLTRQGYIDKTNGGRIGITSEGLDALGSFAPLPTGAALRDYLLNGDKLSTMEKALLRVIFEKYPHGIAKGAILDLAGYKSSGPVSRAFARLVRFGYCVAAGRGELRAHADLFDTRKAGA